MLAVFPVVQDLHVIFCIPWENPQISQVYEVPSKVTKYCQKCAATILLKIELFSYFLKCCDGLSVCPEGNYRALIASLQGMLGKSIVMQLNKEQSFFFYFSAYSGQNERSSGLIVSATQKTILTSKAREQIDHVSLQ